MKTTREKVSLVDVSMRVIADGQASTGAYVASPHFSQYGFAWLRDGAYCAMAMDAVGNADSATRFHQWVCRVILNQEARIDSIVERLDSGETVPAGAMLPTRFTLDGEIEPSADDAWPNFQLDGYGTWLFALNARTTDKLPAPMTHAVELTARYLNAAWRVPCFDYWEEYGDRRHTATLAAIAAGLSGASQMLDQPEYEATARQVRSFIDTNCVSEGSFTKGPMDSRVDGSLLSLAVPFGVVPLDDPRMTQTIARIRAELSTDTGGIRRYIGDTYYGGSPWLLLTAWLGWCDRLSGDRDSYEASRDWVCAIAKGDGLMPEQLVSEPQAPEFVDTWEARWGPVASPLLWSHAKYLLMELGEVV